jgi:hypothetical protein
MPSADLQIDFSNELTEVRRELRAKLLALGDDELRSIVYRTLTLSEHEAGRQAVNAVLTRSSRSNRDEA